MMLCVRATPSCFSGLKDVAWRRWLRFRRLRECYPQFLPFSFIPPLCPVPPYLLSSAGLAIYNSVLLDVHFPLAVYRKLKGEPVGLGDLEGWQPSLHRNLRLLLEYTGACGGAQISGACGGVYTPSGARSPPMRCLHTGQR